MAHHICRYDISTPERSTTCVLCFSVACLVTSGDAPDFDRWASCNKCQGPFPGGNYSRFACHGSESKNEAMIRWWLEVLAIFLPTRGWSFGAWIKCQVAVWRACSWFSTSTAADRLKLIDELWRTSINLSNLSCFLTKIYHSYHLLFFLHIHITLYLRWNQLCIRQSWCEVGFTGGGMLSWSGCETHWHQCITSKKQLVKVTLESYSLMNHSYQMACPVFSPATFHLTFMGLPSFHPLWPYVFELRPVKLLERTDSSDVIAVWSPKKNFQDGFHLHGHVDDLLSRRKLLQGLQGPGRVDSSEIRHLFFWVLLLISTLEALRPMAFSFFFSKLEPADWFHCPLSLFSFILQCLKWSLCI